MGEFTRQPARDIKSALIDSVLAGLLRVNCLWPDRRRGAQRVWFYPRARAGGDPRGGGDGRQAGAQPAAAEPSGKSLYCPL